MTFIKFCENLAERILQAQLKGYFLFVIPDRMVRVDRYQVLSRVINAAMEIAVLLIAAGGQKSIMAATKWDYVKSWLIDGILDNFSGYSTILQ